MKIVLASNNQHKVSEFKKIFSPYGVEILTLKDLNINVDPEENGTTFKENAYIKALEIAKHTSEIIVADDSGLEIEALNGFPGIYSSRYKEGEPYIEKFKGIWELLKNKDNKRCNFTCVLCVYNLENTPIYFEGKVYGEITTNIKKEGGFGYDPIFFYPEYNKTFSECSPEEKNSISHRGKALEMFFNYLKEKKYI